MTTETEKYNHDKIQAEIAKLIAETLNLNTRTAKTDKELKWYEVTIIVAVTLAVVAVSKLFL